MCATYQLSFEDVEEIRKISDEITKKYGSEAASKTFDHDFYPKSKAPVIGKKGQVLLINWGIPLKESRKPVFNSRAESLTAKSFYRPIISNRCLIPATSFYEWSREKTKYRISLPNNEMFYMAALWKSEISSDDARDYYFTILTTQPNRQIEPIHDRMPVIVPAKSREEWLAGGNNGLGLLKPFHEEMLIRAV